MKVQVFNEKNGHVGDPKDADSIILACENYLFFSNANFSNVVRIDVSGCYPYHPMEISENASMIRRVITSVTISRGPGKAQRKFIYDGKDGENGFTDDSARTLRVGKFVNQEGRYYLGSGYCFPNA